MPRRNQSPSATRGVLGHEDRGQAQLPSGGQPLGGPQDHEEHAGAHADPGLPREQADRRGGAAHGQDHRRQQALAPSHVAESSDEDGAERPSEERRGVDGECGQQEIRTLFRGEEDLHQHDPERAEDGEVVPLDDISDAGGDERATRRHRRGQGGGCRSTQSRCSGTFLLQGGRGIRLVIRLPGGARSRRGSRRCDEHSEARRDKAASGTWTTLTGAAAAPMLNCAVRDPDGTFARARALLNQEGPLFRSHGG